MVRRNEGLLDPHSRRLDMASVGIAIVVGTGLGFLVLRAPDLTLYQLVLVAAVGVVALAVLVTSQLRAVLLASLGLTIPVAVAFTPLDDAGTSFHPGGAWGTLVLYPYDVPLFGLLALALLEGLAGRKSGRPTVIHAVAVAMILWAALSVLNSALPALSGFEILRMVKLFLLAVAVVAVVRSERDLRILVAGLLVGLALQSAVSVLQYVGAIQYGVIVGEFKRVPGTLGWPNTLGTYAGALSAFAFSLWVAGGRGGIRAVAIGALLIGLVSLVLSFSRGAWAAFAPALLVSVLVSWRQGWLRGRDMGRLALLAAAGIAVGLVVGQGVVARLTETSLQEAQITDRFLLNQVALNMAAEQPLLGVGVNTFVEVMRDYDVGGVTYRFPEPVHNVYLLTLAEMGGVGLLLLLALLLAAIRQGLHAASSRNRFLSASAIGSVSGLTVIAVSNVADVHLRTDALYLLFWVLIAIVLSVGKLDRQLNVDGASPSPGLKGRLSH